MDVFIFNNSGQVIHTTYTSFTLLDNVSELEINVTRNYPRLNSPVVVATVVLLVFIFSPMTLIGNSLVLVAMYRFKRLRTPSNYLIMSLATSDLGTGMFIPLGIYLELGVAKSFTSVNICLLSYSVAISLCCASVLVMVAIAVDRFTSLARPLRYANLITHTAVERYIVVFWIYASIVGFTPFGYAVHQGLTEGVGNCTFGELIAKPIQLFMFCAVYGPSAVILVMCYGYVYFIARGHARAISEIRHSLQHKHCIFAPSRYGTALAITTGMFLGLWLPFQICMLLDIFADTNILSAWIAVYLALPILASSAFNPWVYGYRNAELRTAVRRVVDDFLNAIGFTYRSNQRSDPIVLSAVATAGDPASFIKHVQKEYFSVKAEGDFLLVPIAKPESSGILSESEPRIFRSSSKIVVTPDTPRILTGSRSMIESLAIFKKYDVVVVMGSKSTMTRGITVV